MKCPKCGAYNKPNYKKCYICNTMLPQEYIQETPTDENKLWTKDAFREGSKNDNAADPEANPEPKPKSADTSQGSFDSIIDADEEFSKHEKKQYSIYAKRELSKERGVWGNEVSTKYTRRGEGNIPVVALEDESHISISRKRKRGSKYTAQPLSKNATKIKKFAEGQEVGIVVPPEPPKPKKRKRDSLPKKTTYRKKVNVKWGRLILVSMFAVCLIFGLVVGFIFLAGKISDGMSQIFVPRNQLPNGGEPLVERVLMDGQKWHTITFYGEDGDKILVEDISHNIKRTLTIHNNEAVISLDDYSYIPKSGEEDYFGDPFTYVNIQASHFNSKGEETVLDVPEYRISIPLAPLTIIHPVVQSDTVLTTQVLVKVKVEPESRVIIAKKNMSGNIDADGYTSTYVFLEPNGINRIPILVEVDGYRANNYELLVNSPKRDIDIELIDAPTETQASELRIDGKAELGTTIITDATLLIDYIRVDKNGSFYIKIKLSDFGWNDINLYATSEDGTRTTTLIHKINRIPLEGAYTRSAWVLDYNALSSSANKLVGQVYRLDGVITERIDTPEAKLFKFNAGSASEPRFVIIEYNGNYDIIENIKRYEVYADVMGKFDNYPLLYARFIYESEDQDANGIDDKDEEGYEPPKPDTTEDN